MKVTKCNILCFFLFKPKLALTSNEGAKDFQLDEGKIEPLYHHVLRTSSQWGTPDNMMYVVGATKANMFDDVRRIVPNHFLLVPGVGAQGGSLAEVCKHGIIKNDIGLLINSSRGIIFASNGEDFAEAATSFGGLRLRFNDKGRRAPEYYVMGDREGNTKKIDLFGWNLHKLLEERDLYIQEFAQKLGVSPILVSSWVQGIAFPNQALFTRTCEMAWT